jgi:uncharacterized protein YggT (Ycf19 family)
MTQLMITGGWILNILGTTWIVLIVLNIVVAWLSAKTKKANLLRQWLQQVAEPPINLLRRTLPTVYREMDFAPWLTILILVLMKVFIFRAMIYWGMLNRPPVG